MQSRLAGGNYLLTRLAAVLAAGILMMSCSTPAYAKEDPGWNGQGDAAQEQTEGYVANDPAGGNADGSSPEDTGGDNNGNSGQETESVHTEQGFTTPGNGDLGDEIKSSNGKDFYTVRTKNNNTFFLVIDHTNSTENVYMLSLIDEDDLAEFLTGSEESTEKTAAPVIIPETKPQTETTGGEKEKEQVQQPVPQPVNGNNMLLLILLVLGAAGLIYYFRIYKPGHEEEEDDSEGMEGDGFPTESDDE